MPEPVSVLDGAVAGEGHFIRIADRGPVGQVTLRADLSDPAVAGAVREAAGVDLPGTWQARMAGDGRGAVWFSPDELLILGAYAEAGDMAARLSRALGGTHHLALDVSDARVVLRLEGARVGEALMKGMPVDLRDAAFPPGSVRRSHLGGIAVALWRLDADTWEIVAFRSFGRHLFDWLAASSVAGSEVWPA